MVNVIGPFLGPRGESGISIFIAMPHRSDISKLSCKLYNNGELIQEDQSDPSDDIYKLYTFNFSNLNENELYDYEFRNGEKEIDLEGGLSVSDCRFKPLGSSGKDDSFILLSCNNPFEEEKGSADDGWAMWENLAGKLNDDDTVRLLVLAGDQVYNDEVEYEFIDKLKKNNCNLEDLKKRFIQQYQKYWANISYRKVLASIPSVTMWDDHDITDGFGSRQDMFNGRTLKKQWCSYFEAARESFLHYQASRNPEKIPNVPDGTFSSYFDFGENRFVLADFRTERNLKTRMLWSGKHRDAVKELITKLPTNINRLFFISPVIAFRTNFSGDKRLSALFKCLFWVREREKRYLRKSECLSKVYWLFCILLIMQPLFLCAHGLYRTSVVLFLVGLFLGVRVIFRIPELPDLSDDIEDGLSSDSNRKSLGLLLDDLFSTSSKNKEVFILSGDIHLGGLTEIVDTRGNEIQTILQIVSSPIAYKPMPKVVEGLTTTTSEMVIYNCDDKKRLFARNIGYISKRNFVQIYPNRPKDAKRIYFYLEGHEFPISYESSFL